MLNASRSKRLTNWYQSLPLRSLLHRRLQAIADLFSEARTELKACRELCEKILSLWTKPSPASAIADALDVVTNSLSTVTPTTCSTPVSAHEGNSKSSTNMSPLKKVSPTLVPMPAPSPSTTAPRISQGKEEKLGALQMFGEMPHKTVVPASIGACNGIVKWVPKVRIRPHAVRWVPRSKHHHSPSPLTSPVAMTALTLKPLGVRPPQPPWGAPIALCVPPTSPVYTPKSFAKIKIDTMALTRGSLEVPRVNYEPEDAPLIGPDAVVGDQDYAECARAAGRSASWCRSVAVTFTIVLLLRHLIAVVTVGAANQYAFSLLTIYLLRASGILLPFYAVMRLISAVQQGQRQYRLQLVQEQRRNASRMLRLQGQQQQQLQHVILVS